MEYSPAIQDDCASLAALSMEVWVGTYLREGVGVPFAEYVLTAFSPDAFRARLSDPLQSLIVARLPGGPVGFVQLTQGARCPLDAQADVELAHLYVQPRHARKGIGAQLLALAKEAARAQAARQMWLIANVQNTQAIAFYTAQGFVKRGEGGFEIDGVSYPQVILTCPL